jgi:histone deacetylase 1/2
MQDVPRKPFGGMTDEEEAELDDLDEDENKDVRMTEHRWDKHVENGAEFEPSDDDDLATANGATRSDKNKLAFTDFQNADAADEGRSKSPNEKQNDGAQDTAEAEAHDVNDDTIEDVGATEEQQEKESGAEAEEEKGAQEAKKREIDADGDVGMADSTVTDEAPIKKEEGEPQSVPEPETESEKPAKEKSADTEPREPAKAEEPAESKTVDEPATEKEADKPAEKKAEGETTEADAEPEAMDVDENEKPEEKPEHDSSK